MNTDILMVQINGGLKHFFCTTSIHLFPLRFHYNTDSKLTILKFKDVENIPGKIITADI